MTKKKSRASIKLAPKKKKQIRVDRFHNKQIKPIYHEGDERKAHEEIINRRVTGGLDMSREEIAEAYIRAQEQWLQLPGSIIRSPTDILLIQNRGKFKGISAALKQNINDADNGSELT